MFQSRVLCTGDRNWNNEEIVRSALATIGPGTTIMQGMCRGADLQVRKVAVELGIPVEDYPADWSVGKRAGPMRNQEMVNKCPVLVMAFHNNIYNSRGTLDCVKRGLKAGIRVFLFTDTEVRELFPNFPEEGGIR